MSSKSQKITPFNKAKTKSGSLLKYLGLMVIMAMVVVAFVVTPALSSLAGGGDYDFGKFGNLPIRYTQGNYFYNQVNMLNNMYREVLSESPEFFETYRMNIWQTAYNQTLDLIAKKYYMQESGFDISNQALDRAVVESGYYADEDGHFDSMAYQSSSSADREQIREAIYNDMLANQYRNDVVGGLYKNDAQMDFIVNISPEERRISYVAFSFTDYPDHLVREQGELNHSFFQSRELSRMTFRDESAALEALEILAEGEQDFATVAMERSTDFIAMDGGVLGKRYFFEISEELGDELAQSIFQLEVGGITEPMESSYGWYIYKADGGLEDPDFSDETMVSKVRSWMNWNRSDVIDQWLNDQAEILAMDAQDRGWEMAVAAMNHNLLQSDYFSLNWGGSPLIGSTLTAAARDSFLQNANQSDLFFQTVFAMEEGEISEPIPMGNAVLLMRLEDTRENESIITSVYAQSYLQQFRDQAWLEQVKESELYTDNFNQVYMQFFPPQGPSES